MTLEILVCTLGEGITKITNLILPSTHNIKYLISWQLTSSNNEIKIPISLIRDDIKIVTMQGNGLSRNRNNAIEHASGDICLIADDDVTYTSAQLAKVVEIFQSHPSVEVATFKSILGSEDKFFPSYSFDLQRMPRFYHVTSIEIAFRRESIQGVVKFNEHFGLGAPTLLAGEEEVFILDVLKRGIHAEYFPIEIVRHTAPTTSTTRANLPGVIMARGAYLSRRFHSQRYLRAIKIAMRLSNDNGVKFWYALRYVLKGIAYAKKNGLDE